MWNTACLDWKDRLLSGRSLVPDLPLFREEADRALRIFKRLRIPDVIGKPTMGEVAGPWLFPIVEAIFGSYDPESNRRMIQEFFWLIPKKNSKTSTAAAVMLEALIVNRRPEAEFVLVAPSLDISGRSYRQARDTVRADPELDKIFHCRDHNKTISNRLTGATLQVKSADTDIITGGKQVGTMIDEIHELASNSKAAEIMLELRGSLAARPDGFLITVTTQSKARPSGIFKSELQKAREVRDGKRKLPLLPILYELPEEVQLSGEWREERFWHLVNPNLGRSVDIEFLRTQIGDAVNAGPAELALFASQHFNVEVGVGLNADGWPGAEFWASRADPDLKSLADLISRSEVIVIGVDGGGLDDLFGLAVLGREKETRDYLLWSHGWCHRGVLTRRKSIASKLQDFAAAGELTIVDDELQDMTEIVDIIVECRDAGLLHKVMLDTSGPYGELVDALAKKDISAAEGGQVEGVKQGGYLMGAIKTMERKVANGTLRHSGSGLMNWCVGNVKIERTATSIRATKQNAGDAKIDLFVAAADAVSEMVNNPTVAGDSYLDRQDLIVI